MRRVALISRSGIRHLNLEAIPCAFFVNEIFEHAGEFGNVVAFQAIRPVLYRRRQWRGRGHGHHLVAG